MLYEIKLERGKGPGMAKRASKVFSYYVRKYLAAEGYYSIMLHPHNWLALKRGELPLVVLCTFYPRRYLMRALLEYHYAGVINVARASPQGLRVGDTLYLHLYNVQLVPLDAVTRPWSIYPYSVKGKDIVFVVDDEDYSLIISGKRKLKEEKEEEEWSISNWQLLESARLLSQGGGSVGGEG